MPSRILCYDLNHFVLQPNEEWEISLPVLAKSSGQLRSSARRTYLYTSQIHARSLLPCQDTPAIKASYSSRVKSTLPVLMSGLRQSPPSEEVLEPGKEVEYVYDQPVAIPSYLIAIASGELIYKPFKPVPGRGWRTGVWTEPLMMDAAFWEFREDTAKSVP